MAKNFVTNNVNSGPTQKELEDSINSIASDLIGSGWNKDLIEKTRKRIISSGLSSEKTSLAYFRSQARLLMNEIKDEERDLKESNEVMERQEYARRKIESERGDLAVVIENYLMNDRNCTCVTAREISDILYDNLSDYERNYYFNNPFYAAKSSIGKPIFDKSLSMCVEKYQNSLIVRETIEEYLNDVSPKRDMDDHYIAQLISTLPDSIQRYDDDTYKAYRAICILKDKSTKSNVEVSAEDIALDPYLSADFTASIAVDIEEAEPYNVAYRNAFEKYIGKTANAVGVAKAMPKHLVDVAEKSMNVGVKKTLGDQLYQKERVDMIMREKANEHRREREELEEKLATMEKQLEQTRSVSNYQNNKYTDSRYSSYDVPYGYSNPNSPYNRNNYNNRNNNNQMEPKFMVSIVNVILIILLFIVNSLTQASTIIPIIGLGLATFGLLTKGDSGKGMNTRCIVLGYAATAVGFFIMFM